MGPRLNQTRSELNRHYSDRLLAVAKEITHPNHRERQFMQHLRGVGWIKAGTLPSNRRTVKNLLQRGWIEQQHQGPKNEVFLRLTDKGLEAKKSPIPRVELGLKAKK
jgi:hypothetical protein